MVLVEDMRIATIDIQYEKPFVVGKSKVLFYLNNWQEHICIVVLSVATKHSVDFFCFVCICYS